MTSNNLFNKHTLIFLLVGIVFVGLMLFVEIHNGRFWLNDFKVMYSAADALVNDEQVYGLSFGLSTGFYKYSPFTLLLFVPASLLIFKTASIIHFIFIGLSALSVILILEKLIRSYFKPTRKKTYFSLLAVLLCVVIHLVRDLHLGNINMILVLALTLVLYYSLNNKPILAGILLALTVLAKPYFLICILPLLVHKKYKAAVSTIAGIFICVVLVFIILPDQSSHLFQDWFSAMLDHNTYLGSSQNR